MSGDQPASSLKLQGGGRLKRPGSVMDRSWPSPWVTLVADSKMVMIIPDGSGAPSKGNYLNAGRNRQRCGAKYDEIEDVFVAPSPSGMRTTWSLTFTATNGDAFCFSPNDEEKDELLAFLQSHSVSIKQVDSFIHPRTGSAPMPLIGGGIDSTPPFMEWQTRFASNHPVAFGIGLSCVSFSLVLVAGAVLRGGNWLQGAVAGVTAAVLVGLRYRYLLLRRRATEQATDAG